MCRASRSCARGLRLESDGERRAPLSGRRLNDDGESLTICLRNSPSGPLGGVALWLAAGERACDRLGADRELEVDLDLVARLEAPEDRRRRLDAEVRHLHG